MSDLNKNNEANHQSAIRILSNIEKENLFAAVKNQIQKDLLLNGIQNQLIPDSQTPTELVENLHQLVTELAINKPQLIPQLCYTIDLPEEFLKNYNQNPTKNISLLIYGVLKRVVLKVCYKKGYKNFKLLKIINSTE
ncbi:MAG: hypothetical protein ACQESK_04110 [Bacteroidota bacterium]